MGKKNVPCNFRMTSQPNWGLIRLPNNSQDAQGALPDTVFAHPNNRVFSWGERQVMRVTVQAQFNLFGVVKRQGDWYIAHCPPLDITTQGRTLAEAKKNLVEASELFIVSCFERGTLDQALKEPKYPTAKNSVAGPFSRCRGDRGRALRASAP
jgi:predicted RNase H-like HicB family nuclease